MPTRAQAPNKQDDDWQQAVPSQPRVSWAAPPHGTGGHKSPETRIINEEEDRGSNLGDRGIRGACGDAIRKLVAQLPGTSGRKSVSPTDTPLIADTDLVGILAHVLSLPEEHLLRLRQACASEGVLGEVPHAAARSATTNRETSNSDGEGSAGGDGWGRHAEGSKRGGTCGADTIELPSGTSKVGSEMTQNDRHKQMTHTNK